MALACISTTQATTQAGTRPDSLPKTSSSQTLSSPLVETRFVYDPKSDLYLLTTFLNGKPFGTPLPYTADEYLRYQSHHSQARYWDILNSPLHSPPLAAGQGRLHRGKHAFIDRLEDLASSSRELLTSP